MPRVAMGADGGGGALATGTSAAGAMGGGLTRVPPTIVPVLVNKLIKS